MSCANLIDINIAAILGLDVDEDSIESLISYYNGNLYIDHTLVERTRDPEGLDPRAFLELFAPTGYSSRVGSYDYSDAIALRGGFSTPPRLTQIVSAPNQYGYERCPIELTASQHDHTVATYILADGVYEIHDVWGDRTVLIVAGQILATVFDAIAALEAAQYFFVRAQNNR